MSWILSQIIFELNTFWLLAQLLEMNYVETKLTNFIYHHHLVSKDDLCYEYFSIISNIFELNTFWLLAQLLEMNYVKIKVINLIYHHHF